MNKGEILLKEIDCDFEKIKKADGNIRKVHQCMISVIAHHQ
ncbi:hypothetical protein [Aeribacillus pallidus]|nr:hypothetical protein [Aeribacillus pallidus]